MFKTAARGRLSLEGHTEGSCDCIVCRTERPFEMPEQLVTACIAGDLVVFAGAGISTEAPTVMPFTLYEHVRGELDLDPSEDLSFPALMTKFEAARGRMTLLETIKQRLDYVKSFPSIDGQASQFHKELAGVFTVKEIVTTNWDDYFERCCGAQPFVTDEDWVFSKSSERKVFKLHGSILNPGSIIATEADYKRCYRNLNQGLVGAKLKETLATKTIVFIGYSLRDSDFVRLYRLMKRRMGDILPRSYIVTLDDGEQPHIAKDMHIIHTNGVHFLRELKGHFTEGELIADERFDAIPAIRSIVAAVHHDLVERGEMRQDPAMLVCACYQDGLLDAFDHITANKRKGDYSHRCYTEGIVNETYARLLKEREDDGRWLSVAYVQGYMNGLTFLIADDELRPKMPLYYVIGSNGDVGTFEEYEEVARYFPTLNRKAYKYAKAQAEKLAPGVVFQHLPTLL